MDKIDKITQIVGRKFRSFGGGQKGFNNPVAAALQDSPLQFAAGVDIKSVVEIVLDEAAWLDLLSACKDFDKSFFKEGQVCIGRINKARIKAKVAVKKAKAINKPRKDKSL